MILRRIAKGIKDQDWFVVTIEVVIVVIGIFLGMQVTQWYEEQAAHKLETELLIELKKELEAAINNTQSRADAYTQARESARRSSDFLASERSCADNCWQVIVDFLHASQWQSADNRESTYNSMRLQGLPKSRAIIDAVEAYLLESKENTNYLNERPVYRSLVRRYIPWRVAQVYWENCYAIVDGLDQYDPNCVVEHDPNLMRIIVEDITTNGEIKRYLTEWTGGLATIPESLIDQNETAMRAIHLIDAELETRK